MDNFKALTDYDTNVRDLESEIFFKKRNEH